MAVFKNMISNIKSKMDPLGTVPMFKMQPIGEKYHTKIIDLGKVFFLFFEILEGYLCPISHMGKQLERVVAH